MSDLSTQFFHSEDLFRISTLSHGRHTSETAAKSANHIVKPEGVHELQRENVENNMLLARPKEVTLLVLCND